MRTSSVHKLFVFLTVFMMIGSYGYRGKCVKASETATVEFFVILNDGTITEPEDTQETPKEKKIHRDDTFGCFMDALEKDHPSLLDASSDCNIKEVVSVTITISGQGLDTPIEVVLSQSAPGDPYTGIQLDLPPDIELTFEGRAKNESGEIIFEGSTTALLDMSKITKIVMTISCVFSPYVNYLPIIALKTSDEWFFPGELAPIEIKIGDDDNDEIICEISHSSQKGSLSNTGGLITLMNHRVGIETVLATDSSDTYSDTITVKVDDQAGGIAEAYITIPVKIPSITLSPHDNAVSGVKDSLQFAVTGKYFGSTRDLASLTSWSSSNTSVVTVDPNGFATGVSIGSAIITAHIGDVIEKEVTFVVIDAIKIAEGGHIKDTIQMVFNTYSKELNIVHTKDDDLSDRREIWFKSHGKEGIYSSQIGFCHPGNWACPISIAINPATGQPAVTYWDPNGKLTFAQLINEVWEKEIVYSYGWNCSLAFDPSDNYPAIAFNSIGDWNLRYAKRKDSIWDIRTLRYCDADFECLRFHPETKERCISYYDWYGFCGRGLHFEGGIYSAHVDEGSGIGVGNSLTFDQKGNPHITYLDRTHNGLKHAWWTATEWVTEIVDTDLGGIYEEITSCAISNNNKIHVSYTTGRKDLRYAYYDCNLWITETVWDSDNYDVGEWSSVALNDKGAVNIAFITNDGAWLVTKERETEYWNNDGDFELALIDTGSRENECYIDAPWDNISWGIEGSTFSDPTNHAIDMSQFTSCGHKGYLYGKEESGKWGLVRYIQGDVWGGTHCGPIAWNRPAPILTIEKDITLEIDIYRDINNLLSSDSWVMFAVNIWLSSHQLPEGTDINGRKPIVMDLLFYHDCNWSGCGIGHFEDDDAFHYQVLIGETPYKQWHSWSIGLNEHIQEVLNYQWPSGSIAYVKETLKLYQLEFVIELKNAEGAANIDNFFLKSTDE
ncbi:MAG: Ig-like domain-containing protein [bacterium]